MSKDLTAADAQTNGQQGQPRHTFLTEIPDYDTAAPDVKARMDDIIAKFDPYDVNHAIEFGNDAVKKNSGVVDDILKKSQETGVFVKDIENLPEMLDALDLGSLASRAAKFAKQGASVVAKNPGKAAATVGALAFLGPIYALATAAGAYGAGKIKGKISKEDQLEKLEEDLRDSVVETAKIVDQLSTFQGKLPEMQTDIQRLARVRIEAHGELGVYVGAGREILRRLDCDTIPEAATRFTVHGGQQDQEDVRVLQLSRRLLDQRVTDLTSTMTLGINAAVTLADMRDILGTMSLKASSHLSTSVPLWSMQIAEGGIVLGAFKGMKALNAADQHGDKMVDGFGQLHLGLRDMAKASAGRGIYDPEKIITATGKLATALRSDATALGQIGTNLESKRAALIAAAEDLKGAVATRNDAEIKAAALPAPAPAAPRLGGPGMKG